MAAQLCLAVSMNGRSKSLVVRRLTGSQATRRWTHSGRVAERWPAGSSAELRWENGDVEPWLVAAALSIVEAVGDGPGLGRAVLRGAASASWAVCPVEWPRASQIGNGE